MGRKRQDYKMLPCVGCCPAGIDGMGRYHKAGKTAHRYDVEDWNAEQLVWGWRCDNCRRFKKPRAPQARIKIDPFTCTAKEAEKLNVRSLARFHYFNPNGVYGEWKAFGNLIDKAITERIVASGFYLAYGPGGYHHEQLSQHATGKKPLKVWNLDYTVKAIREQITKGMTRLEEALAEKGHTIEKLTAL